VRTKVGDRSSARTSRAHHASLAKITWLKPFFADTTTGLLRSPRLERLRTRALIYAFSEDNKTRSLETVDPAAKITTLESLRDTAWVGGPCGECGGWLRRWQWAGLVRLGSRRLLASLHARARRTGKHS